MTDQELSELSISDHISCIHLKGRKLQCNQGDRYTLHRYGDMWKASLHCPLLSSEPVSDTMFRAWDVVSITVFRKHC